MPKKGIPRMVCKICSDIFLPETFRERVTGTCEKETCWRPFSDREGLEFVKEDLYDFVFECLRCSAKIYTDSRGERLCGLCRRRVKSKKSFSSS